MKSVTIVSFSPRNNGNCGRISEFLYEYYKRTNVRSFAITAENFSACSGCDYECLTPGKICPSITEYQTEVMNSIKESDHVYMIVPNFCGHPCANYYAFNERCVGYYNGDRALMAQYLSVPKRFIIVSNTEGAAFDPAMRQQVNGDPDVLYLKSGKYQKKSIAGDILDSEAAVADLEAFLQADNLV